MKTNLLGGKSLEEGWIIFSSVIVSFDGAATAGAAIAVAGFAATAILNATAKDAVAVTSSPVIGASMYHIPTSPESLTVGAISPPLF